VAKKRLLNGCSSAFFAVFCTPPMKRRWSTNEKALIHWLIIRLWPSVWPRSPAKSGPQRGSNASPSEWTGLLLASSSTQVLIGGLVVKDFNPFIASYQWVWFFFFWDYFFSNFQEKKYLLSKFLDQFFFWVLLPLRT
jgi:hypothetical protein